MKVMRFQLKFLFSKKNMKLSIFHFVDKKKHLLLHAICPFNTIQLSHSSWNCYPKFIRSFIQKNKIHVADSDYKSTRALIRFIFQNMLLTLQRTQNHNALSNCIPIRLMFTFSVFLYIHHQTCLRHRMNMSKYAINGIIAPQDRRFGYFDIGCCFPPIEC